jgi:hypothetical protein
MRLPCAGVHHALNHGRLSAVTGCDTPGKWSQTGDTQSNCGLGTGVADLTEITLRVLLRNVGVFLNRQRSRAPLDLESLVAVS